MQQIELETKFTYLTSNLDAKPDVLGMSHEFPFQGATVRIALPAANQVTDAHGSEDFDAATIGKYQHDTGGKQIPETIQIHRLYITVRQGKRIAFAPEVFTNPPNAYEHIPEDDQERLRSISAEAQFIGSGAVAYWLSILRWKFYNYRLGRPSIMRNTTGRADLYDVETGRTMWIHHRGMGFWQYDSISMARWAETAELLKAGTQVPIHISLMQDAEDYFERSDYRRTMIDIAVSLEVFLRSQVLRTLPDTLDADMATMIEQSNITQYVNKFFPNLLQDEGMETYKKEKLSKELTSLFDARNKIMHMANDERATEEECQRFILLGRKLFSLAEKFK